MTDTHWVFGYGSLVWRPGFAHVERRPGRVRGWTRRFWQGSTDHRGVPGAPGRVVTLVPAAGQECWGMAYRVDPGRVQEVLAGLDVREQGGYTRHTVAVHGEGEPIDGALMYVATEHNANYLGAAPDAAIAEQVRRSTGPSGPNSEYVLRLAEALRSMGAEDEHVFAIDALVRGA